MKTFNIMNAVFYIAYGLFGAFVPACMAKIMGWTPDLLGMHQLRAMFMAMATMGLAAFITAKKSSDQAPLLMVFIALTLAFMVGRFLGLILDGVGPVQTYAEIAFEMTWASIGAVLLKRGMRVKA